MFHACLLSHCQPGSISHMRQFIFVMANITQYWLVRHGNSHCLITHITLLLIKTLIFLVKIHQVELRNAKMWICFAAGNKCFIRPSASSDWRWTSGEYSPVLILLMCDRAQKAVEATGKLLKKHWWEGCICLGVQISADLHRNHWLHLYCV